MTLSWEDIDSRPIPDWFQKSKFGIFIHWGVFSVPAYRGINNELFGSYAEWYYASVYGNYRNHDIGYHKKKYGDIEYRDFANDFKCERFDAKEWADIFKSSGARYVVVTAKHHDGYCIWNTKCEDKKNWNSMDIGPKKDLLKEIRKSVLEKEIRFGVYYSVIDWETNRSHRVNGGYFIPLKDVEKYGIDEEKYPDRILIPQLKELVENYKPSLIFFDGGEWDCTEEYVRAKDFLSWLYEDSSVKNEVVVNDRLFRGMEGKHGDYFSTEYKDKVVSEPHPWEESRGIGKSYGYNKAERLDDYLAVEELINLFVGILLSGGNLLLNVGPKKDGTIPINQEMILRGFGKWFYKNEEAIIDTVPSEKFSNATFKNNCEYVFFKGFDEIKNLKIQGDIKNISLLGYSKDISYVIDNGEIELLEDISAFDYEHKEYSVLKIEYK